MVLLLTAVLSGHAFSCMNFPTFENSLHVSPCHLTPVKHSQVAPKIKDLCEISGLSVFASGDRSYSKVEKTNFELLSLQNLTLSSHRTLAKI